MFKMSIIKRLLISVMSEHYQYYMIAKKSGETLMYKHKF